MRISRLCVYCGSNVGLDPGYAETAQELGAALARANIELVYGGGRIGLMGVVADAALAAGGRVVGIIPDRLRARELAHEGATKLVIAASMHERKRLMAERADAFAVLPGGIGTLDEMFEMLTWRQLGLHDKPIYLIDVAGYWQPLRQLLDHLDAQGFTPGVVPRLLHVVANVGDLLTALGDTNPGGLSHPELL